MKNNQALLVLAFLVMALFIFAVGYLTPHEQPASAKLEATPPNCSAGVTAVSIPSSESGSATGFVESYYLVPNQGCELPVLYCVYQAYGYGAGLSCNPVSE